MQSAQCCFKSTKAADETNSELDERVIKQLIAGICLPEVQKALLAKDNKLTLNKAVQIARYHEASIRHMKQLQIAQGASNSTGVAAIRTNKGAKKYQKCGTKHLPKPQEKCPAFSTECHICKKPNHWASVCKSSKAKQESGKVPNGPRQHKSNPRRKVQEVGHKESSED